MIRRNSTTEKQRVGDIGEKAVRAYLKKQGYKILEENLQIRKNEVDLIVSKGDVIAFVEVKTRTQSPENCPAWLRPVAAVDAEKRKGMISVARSYIKKGFPGYRFEFDVAEVFLSPEGKVEKINYMERAFRG